MVSEMSDVQAHGGDVWIKEAEVVVITKLYGRLGLHCVVSGGTRAEGVGGEMLGTLLKLR